MRGTWIKLAVAATLALGVSACGAEVEKSGSTSSSTGAATSADAAPDTGTPRGGTLTISNWDKYMPENLIPDFERKTGIKVKVAKHATNEDIMGKLEAAQGGGYDLVFVSAPFAESLARRGWAAEIDPAKVPNLSNLAPEARARLRPRQQTLGPVHVGHDRPLLPL